VVCYLLFFVCESPSQTLPIIHVEGHATTLTATQMANLPQVAPDARDHDKPARFEGVRLSALLSAAGIQLGDTVRGPRMTEVLPGEGADAYNVVFALAEFDPVFAPREIILADRRDASRRMRKKALFPIVAPGGKRPARWAGQTATLRVTCRPVIEGRSCSVEWLQLLRSLIICASHADAHAYNRCWLVNKTNHYGEASMPNSPIQYTGYNPARDIAPFRRHEQGTQPDYFYHAYRATRLRAPSQPLIFLPHTVSELTGPVFGHSCVHPNDRDLTLQHASEPLGERMIVRGRVVDGDGHAVSNSLIEIWQANAAGRYAHAKDDHPAPLDPNFSGTGRTLTDNDGFYSFVTIKPGAYPWRNHDNAWRPAHIHFSLFGPAFVTRLITQMYFPGDPLFAYDPILQSIPDERARQRLVSKFDLETTKPEWALGYRFDIVLRGRESTPFEK